MGGQVSRLLVAHFPTYLLWKRVQVERLARAAALLEVGEGGKEVGCSREQSSNFLEKGKSNNPEGRKSSTKKESDGGCNNFVSCTKEKRGGDDILGVVLEDSKKELEEGSRSCAADGSCAGGGGSCESSSLLKAADASLKGLDEDDSEGAFCWRKEHVASRRRETSPREGRETPSLE